MRLTKLFKEFFDSEKAGGLILIICTLVSLIIANTVIGPTYLGFWDYHIGNHSISNWVNDGLMTIFFLLIGLELEREIYIGELSNLKAALLPVFAALGGMLLPAGLHFMLNAGTPTQSGAGIPMATDIAFAIGVLSILGKRVPIALKVFLTALAVIDDLGAIFTIAFFYSSGVSFLNLGLALGILGGLILLNRLKVYKLLPYLIGGIAMWYFMMNSGVHPTISGVLLAFAIPFGAGDKNSISYKLQKVLHKPVAYLILPIFALANTCIALPSDWSVLVHSHNDIGIFLGLIIGKPLGITIFSFVAVTVGLSALPKKLTWKQIFGAGCLGGIGFTMSIFITLLAFDDQTIITDAKLSVLISSLIAGIIGLIVLSLVLKKQKA